MRHDDEMVAFAVILLIVGIVLALLGLLVEAVQFLLWIGLVVILIAIIAWLLRVFRRNA